MLFVRMKKVLLSLLMLMLASAAWAVDVTFLPTGCAPTAQPFTITKECVTIEFSNGMDNGSMFRVYKGQQMVITSFCGPIVRILIECLAEGDNQYGPGCFTVVPDGYQYDGKKGIWIGSSERVVFTALKNQVRMTRIIVTLDDGTTLAAPVISPPSGSYWDPIEVSMSCCTPDAAIYYTVNGSTPTTASTLYTAPFELNANTTVKAISSLDGEVSNVVAADYTFFPPGSGFSCFEELEDLADGTLVISAAPVYVLAQYNHHLYVKDKCGGCAYLYGNTGQTYHTGDVIPAGFTATITTYNGERELNNLSGFKPAEGYVTITPETIDGEVLGHDLFAHYLYYENVTFVLEDGNYYIIDKNGNKYPVYFGLGFTPVINFDFHYDVWAIVGSYGKENTIYQLLLLNVSCREDYTLCDLFEMPDNQVVNFNHEVTVLAQLGNYLYLKDGDCYGYVYGQVGQTYYTGDVIPSGWGGTKKTYNDDPELTNPVGFRSPVRHDNVIPEEITAQEFGQATWGHYVVFRQVIVDYQRKVLIDKDGNEIPFYVRDPNQALPTDMTKRFDVIGIVGSYGKGANHIYQLIWLDYEPKQLPIDVRCFNDLVGLPKGTEVHFVTPLTAVFQSGINLYVADSCGVFMLMFGSAGGPFSNGDLIEGYATVSEYNGFPQLTPYGDWQKVGMTNPVMPSPMWIEELSQNQIHYYYVFEDVTVTQLNDYNYLMTDDTEEEVTLYNKFRITIPTPSIGPLYHRCDVNRDGEVTIADINMVIYIILQGVGRTSFEAPLAIDEQPTWEHCDVAGFLSIYKNEFEVFPVYVNERNSHSFQPDYDVNGDGEITIADINAIINYILTH